MKNILITVLFLSAAATMTIGCGSAEPITADGSITTPADAADTPDAGPAGPAVAPPPASPEVAEDDGHDDIPDFPSPLPPMWHPIPPPRPNFNNHAMDADINYPVPVYTDGADHGSMPTDGQPQHGPGGHVGLDPNLEVSMTTIEDGMPQPRPCLLHYQCL